MGRSYIKYFAALLLCGSNGIMASCIMLSSSEIVFLRTLIGAMLLIAVLFVTQRKLTCHKHPHDLVCLVVSGAALGASWLFLFEAYRLIGVGPASLAYYCGPIIVTVLSPWLFRERLTLAKISGLGLVLVGVLLVNSINIPSENNLSTWGLFCGVMSAVMYAIMVVFSKKTRHSKGLENTALQLVFAFGAVAVFLATQGNLIFDISGDDWLPVMILGLVNTGIGCYLYFSSIGILPAQTVSICGYLEPLSAVVLSAMLLGETLIPLQAIGIAFIVGGAVVSECSTIVKLPSLDTLTKKTASH
ncbi:MAG: DMT family transporter [Gordonibacter sp.]|nr:DMT family transporter [Gordonibacter sp.]